MAYRCWFEVTYEINAASNPYNFAYNIHKMCSLVRWNPLDHRRYLEKLPTYCTLEIIKNKIKLFTLYSCLYVPTCYIYPNDYISHHMENTFCCIGSHNICTSLSFHPLEPMLNLVFGSWICRNTLITTQTCANLMMKSRWQSAFVEWGWLYKIACIIHKLQLLYQNEKM